MTPNAGFGGNCAIESAAALANSIKSMLDSSATRPSIDVVKRYLKDYEKSQWQRVSAIMKVANSVTRLQALKGFKERLTVFCIMPNAGDILLDMHGDMLIAATKLDYLPLPERSFAGTMPFNPEQGIGKGESILYRALLALPFLALSALAFNRMDASHVIPEEIGQMLRTRTGWDADSLTLSKNFYRVEWLDNMFRDITIVFASGNFEIDPVAWW